ncbi:MAG: SEC-C metal-binding domain-containing protein [Candidatus Bipolaricaulia bacterium]
MAKPRRNDPCPCGIGKKYKHCCLAKDEQARRAEAEEDVHLQELSLELEGLSAEDLMYEGWEALRHDPDLADAYNGLGEVALARRDIRKAETHYRTALEKARAALGTEDPQAFDW